MKKQLVALAVALALALTPAGCARDAEPAPARENTTRWMSITTNPTAIEPVEKEYCPATLEDDFEDNKVLVNILHSVSMQLVEENRELTADDFPGVDVAAIRRIGSRTGLINWDMYVEGWAITLTQHSKEHVLEMVKHIEQFDFVQSAEPNYYLLDDWLDED
ncbi:MAG: hypothetical protein ACOYJY_02240 [Acutalibacteraceae bacterium]